MSLHTIKMKLFQIIYILFGGFLLVTCENKQDADIKIIETIKHLSIDSFHINQNEVISSLEKSNKKPSINDINF